MPANLENSAVATGLKRSVFTPIPKKGNAKECSNYRTIALISHASKVMLKILQARLQQFMNRELPDVQAGFRKGRGTRDHMATVGFSKFAGILSAALSQHHLSGFEIAPLEFHQDRKSTRLNSSHTLASRMPSSA